LPPIAIKIDKKIVATIGYYDELHGEGSKTVNRILTQAQLEKLIIHYARIILDIEDMWEMGQTGSYEIRWHPYSIFRLQYFERFVSHEYINEIFNSIVEKRQYKKKIFFKKKKVTITKAEEKILKEIETRRKT